MLGITNLRGAMVPVVDLRARFALAQCEFGPTTDIIVLRTSGEDHERIMGIVVDAVSDVYNVPGDSVGPPPDLGGNMETHFVRGLARVQEKMVILLEVDNLIDAQSAKQLGEATR